MSTDQTPSPVALLFESYLNLLDMQQKNLETFVQMQDTALELHASVTQTTLETNAQLFESFIKNVSFKEETTIISDSEPFSFLKNLTLSKISLFKTVRDYWLKRSSNMADKVKRVCAASLIGLLTTVSGRAITPDCLHDYQVTELPNLQEVKSSNATTSDLLSALGQNILKKSTPTKEMTSKDLERSLQEAAKQRLEMQRRAEEEARREEKGQEQKQLEAERLERERAEAARLELERQEQLAEEARLELERQEQERIEEERRQQEAEWADQLDGTAWGSVRWYEIQAERYRTFAQWYPYNRDYYTQEADRFEQQAATMREREEEVRRAEAARLERERQAEEARLEAERHAAEPAEAGAYEALRDRLLALDGFQAPLEQMRHGARVTPGNDSEHRAVKEAFWKQVADHVEAQEALNPEAAEGERKYLNVIKLLSEKAVPDLEIGNEHINDHAWIDIRTNLQRLAEEVSVPDQVRVEGELQNSRRQIGEWLGKLMEFYERTQQLRNQVLKVLNYLRTLNNDGAGNREKAVHIFKEYIIENSTHCKDRALSGLENIETYMKIVNSPDAKTALGALIQLYKKQIIEQHLIQYFHVDEHGNILRNDRGEAIPQGETVEKYLYLVLMLNQRLGLGIPNGTEMGYARCGAVKSFDTALRELSTALMNQDQLITFLQDNEIWQSILKDLPEYRELEQRLGEQRAALSELMEGADGEDGEDIPSVGDVLEKISDGEAINEAERGILRRMAESEIFRELKAEKEAAGNRDALKVLALIEEQVVEDLPEGWCDRVWGGNYDGLGGELYNKIAAQHDEGLQGFTRRLFEAEYYVTGYKYAGFTVGQIAEMQAVVEEAANPYPEDEEQRIARELQEARAQLAARETALRPETARLQALIEEDAQRMREIDAPYNRLQDEERDAQTQLDEALRTRDAGGIAAAQVVLRDAQAAFAENERLYREADARRRQHIAEREALLRNDPELTRLRQRIRDLQRQQNPGHFGDFGW